MFISFKSVMFVWVDRVGFVFYYLFFGRIVIDKVGWVF